MTHTRRDFLKGAVSATALYGTLAALAGEIAKIESFSVIYPMKGRLKFFDGPGLGVDVDEAKIGAILVRL